MENKRDGVGLDLHVSGVQIHANFEKKVAGPI
jgi:hypothetical protein